MYLRRLVAAALTALVVPATGAMAVLGAATGQPQARAAQLPTVAAALDAHYDSVHELVEEARSDDTRRQPNRAWALRALARPDRQLLHFDPAGDGRVVEVHGDLQRATRIAVVVPGADTRLDTFDGRGQTPWAAPGEAASNLFVEVRGQDPDASLAVVAWLGYDAPETLRPDVLTDRNAQDASAELRVLLDALDELNDAEIVLLCHSYGSMVCAAVADEVAVVDLVVYGSPGMGAANAGALDTHARVWAARGTADWIRHIPYVHIKVGGTGIGFGTDPVSPEFGARVFDAGDAGHSDYFAPGSRSLTNLAAIALGRIDEVDL